MAIWKGEQPQVGGLLAMVINHLPTGMILQVVGETFKHPDSQLKGSVPSVRDYRSGTKCANNLI